MADSFACEECGETLAVLVRKQNTPVLRIAAGFAFRPEGDATCPSCGHETRINVGALAALIREPQKAN